MLLVCFVSWTGAFLIGIGFVFGVAGTHESFGLVEFGVVGVVGVVVVDVERITPIGDDGFDWFAVNNIDCRKGGLTIS